MFFAKYFSVLLLFNFFNNSLSVTTKEQNIAADLFGNISNLAIQSRQYLQTQPYIHQNGIYLKNQDYYRYPYYQDQYPIYAKPYPANSYIRPHSPFDSNQNIRQNIMDVLYKILKNDDLQCVPKIVGEVTAGTMYGRQYAQNLPININLESLVGLLTSLNGFQASPVLYFGKAALLGYTSKGNSRSCSYAYPECPSEPDKLIQYLNNHNGGFFRYFNGFQSVNGPYYPNYGPQYYNKKRTAEERIQNSPVTYISTNSIRQNKGITFPKTQDYYLRPSNSLVFPSDIYTNNIDNIRQSKNLYYDYPPNFEKPLPNHKASPFIFPDRTGTGQFVIDSEDFDKKNLLYKQQQNEYANIQDIRNYYFKLNNFRTQKGLFFPQ